ncbi:MAG: hypothetical protein NTV19_14890 [Burkholderiales bacterium]|nr:hypothetical protein [Burkholderiales bacterium]
MPVYANRVLGLAHAGKEHAEAAATLDAGIVAAARRETGGGQILGPKRMPDAHRHGPQQTIAEIRAEIATHRLRQIDVDREDRQQ